ncbi:MAG: T9SS type A sorting domain-containing protein, partial [Bacteroidales bacterium]|nr:T9SS type A sorting domain-containing protein [Bacteroidales bacterium]
TVYQNASSSDAGFGTAGFYASTTPIVELINNIIVNVSTPGASGNTVAYWRSTTSLGTYATTSNNNDFYAGTPGPNNLIYYDGTNADQTLADYKARVSPADASSITENPPFVNKVAQPYDLHLLTNVPTQLESGGIVVSTPVDITTDYDGDPRYPNPGYPDNPSSPATAPDIGADEFGGLGVDLTAPNIAFTPLDNTASTMPRTLVATITDASGVPTAGIGLPMLYWKINTGSYTGVQATYLGGDDYSFTFGAGVALDDEVSYYVVAQDLVTPTPNIGAIPSGGADGFTFNPPACGIPPTSPYTYVIVGLMCGNYNVGAGQTYATLTDAFADLNLKEITCPVTLTLTDADYSTNETFPLEISAMAGASEMNTVTIKPAPGVSPVISGTATAIFKLNGVKHFIIDGSNSYGSTRDLTITNTSSSGTTAVIWIGSLGASLGATDNVIRNCNISNGYNTSAAHGIFIGAASGVGTAGFDNHNITIQNNAFSRSYYGIYSNGNVSGKFENLVIKDNTLGSDVTADQMGFYAIYLSGANAPLVKGNEVFNMITSTATNQTAIWLASNLDNPVIDGNLIHDLQNNNTGGWGAYGINVATASVAGAVITNNVIYNINTVNYSATSTTYNPFGIRLVSGAGHKIYHNTIHLTGTQFPSGSAGTLSACLLLSVSSVTGTDVRNNIFTNNLEGLAGSKSFAIYAATGTTFGTINYNDYYAYGPYGILGFLGSDITTLSGWQAATGQDGSSVTLNPDYTSPTNFVPTNMALNNIGVYLPSVPKDITGIYRTNPPDMGAYEFGVNPDVTTMNASGISCEGAILNGTINANGLTINAFFDYGETDAYGNTVTGVPDVVTGSTTTAITAMLTGLSGNTTYHFRLRGVGSGGVISYGEDLTFTTNVAGVPTVETQSATNIASTSATLNGTVNANCFSTVVTFEYGTTMAYGSTITAIESPVTGGVDTPVSADLAGLITGQTYHYRVVGENSEGTTYGMDMTFTTGANPPTVTTEPATNIGNFTATLNGTVNANNQNSTVTFEWGLTIGYGNTISATPGVVTGDVTTPVYADLAGLDYNTTYHFRCVATNMAGTTYGADVTFTTLCPVPMAAGAITGPTSVCQSTDGHVYTVAPITYATGYEWTLPAGGTITAGANTTSITVSYSSSAVSGDVGVYGTNVCGSGAQSLLAVTVNPTPVPTITGADLSCIGDSETYTTEAGMTGYVWTVSAGGTITSGTGTHSITVQWNQIGAQYVTVNYTSAAGCPAATPTMLNVSVGNLPTPTITGSNMMCVGSGNHLYTTEGGFSAYQWTVTSGGTIVSGQGTYQIEVNWTVAGSQSVSVNYQNAFGCSAPNPTSMSITVLALPAGAGPVTGTAELCEGTLSVAYSVAAISGATSYMWNVPAGAFISGGAGTNTIRVDFPMGASSGPITVYGENACGPGAASPPFQVSVYPIPATPVITMDDSYMLTSSAPSGNQWYFNGDIIEGATGQTYQVEEEGAYWTMVTLNGCVSDESNHINVIFVGLDELPGTSVSIYPVPNKGVFTIAISNTGMESYTIAIFNALGMKVFEDVELTVDGQFLKTIDLGSGAKGIHTIVMRSGKNSLTRRVLITN